MIANANGSRTAQRKVLAASLCLGVALAAAFAGSPLLIRVAGLFPDSLPANPWLAGHATLLYLGVPVVVTATMAALLAPGALLLLAAGGEARTGIFVLKAFGASFGLRVLGHSIVELWGPPAAPFTAFFAVELALDVPLALFAFLRAHRGTITWPFGTAADRRRLAYVLAIPAVCALALLPALFWQDLSDDGIEALESGWSLLDHLVPRFPTQLGVTSLREGMIATAYPVHWFVALLGPLEVAARLPMAWYLPALFAALLELIEFAGTRTLRASEELTLLAALAGFVVAMSFNSSYYPYAADIASPGASYETLTVLCLAATVLFVWNGQIAWLIGFSVLGFLTRPTELMVLAFLGLGITLVGGEARSTLLRRLAWAMVACLVTWLLYEKLLLPHLAGLAGGGPPLSRIRFLLFTDVRRLLYIAVPTGILPFLSLLWWHRQDREARQITVVCASYSLFFYSQAFVALHHFVPAMILPLVVFWRIQLRGMIRWATPVALALSLLCLWVSLPRTFSFDRTPRRIGCEMAYLVGDYRGSNWHEHRAALMGGYAMSALFGADGGAHPERELLLTTPVLIYYATRCNADPAQAQYVVQPVEWSAPEGVVPVLGDAQASVFVRDVARWREEQLHPPPTDWPSAIYSIPRTTLHRHLGVPAGAYQIDLRRVPILGRLF
jgi:hypothetical protein